MMWLTMRLLLTLSVSAIAAAQFGTPGNPAFLGIPAPAYNPGQQNFGYQSPRKSLH